MIQSLVKLSKHYTCPGILWSSYHNPQSKFPWSFITISQQETKNETNNLLDEGFIRLTTENKSIIILVALQYVKRRNFIRNFMLHCIIIFSHVHLDIGRQTSFISKYIYAIQYWLYFDKNVWCFQWKYCNFEKNFKSCETDLSICILWVHTNFHFQFGASCLFLHFCYYTWL